MRNEKTLKERIEEYVSLSGFAAVVSAVPLLNECLAALTAPVEGELEKHAAYCESAHGSHHSCTADVLRAAGRRIAELEKQVRTIREEVTANAAMNLAADRAASDQRIADLERELAEQKHATQNYRDDALKSAARVAELEARDRRAWKIVNQKTTRIAELERELAATKEQSASRLQALLDTQTDRNQALERAKAAEKEARFHADGWAAANERVKAAEEKNERQARETADLLPHHAMKLDGRTALEWKREAEEQTAKRHDAEQEIGRLRSVIAKPRHPEPVPESRIEGRTHEQTHARLLDAERRCGDLQEEVRKVRNQKDAWESLAKTREQQYNELAKTAREVVQSAKEPTEVDRGEVCGIWCLPPDHAPRCHYARAAQTPDHAFEARKRDAVKHLDSLPGRYRMPGYDAMVTLSIKQLLESLPSPAAPVKREVTEEMQKIAKQLRDDAGQSIDFLSESLRDDLRRAADLLDGGEGR